MTPALPLDPDLGPSRRESQLPPPAAFDDFSTQTTTSLGVPLARRRSRSPDPSSQEFLATSDDNAGAHRLGRIASNRSAASPAPPATPSQDDGQSTASRKPAPTWKGALVAFWTRNKGVFLVLLAQVFGSVMNVTTRLLENPGPDADGNVEQGMHPFQILFARMSVTTICSTAVMWWLKVPDFPLGAKEVRWLLVARGLGGFWGVFGLYWSLQYLPLSDATVLTFLAPIIACWVCSKVLNESFTRVERIGGIISLVGVVFIARPSSIFNFGQAGSSAEVVDAAIDDRSAPYPHLFLARRAESSGIAPSIPEASPQQRLAAVGMAMLGVCGAACAYTTIRWIGRRADSLISVNYFAAWCTIVSSFFLIAVPSIPFVLPHTLRQWLLLFFIGVSGFVMQYLLTAGLRYERGSRPTHMAYSQMLFALAFDFVVWGLVPDWMSVVGSALILGSAVVVAVQKETTASQKGDVSLAATLSAADGRTSTNAQGRRRGNNDDDEAQRALVDDVDDGAHDDNGGPGQTLEMQQVDSTRFSR